MEYAGEVGVEPPFGPGQQARLSRAGWTTSRGGARIRPRPDTWVDAAVLALRRLVALELGQRSYAGVVAAYDEGAGSLVLITVRDGRVSRRSVRMPRVELRSNVIDLSSRRPPLTREIS